MDCPARISPPARPRASLLIVSLDCRLLFRALGDNGELMTAAGSPHGGQVGARTALRAAGQLPPSLQPLLSPGNRHTQRVRQSTLTCAWSIRPTQRLQAAETHMGYTFVTADGSLMKTDSRSMLKEQEWGKVHLEARPLAIFTRRICQMGLPTAPPSGLSPSYSKLRHKKHLEQCLVPSTFPTGTG